MIKELDANNFDVNGRFEMCLLYEYLHIKSGSNKVTLLVLSL